MKKLGLFILLILSLQLSFGQQKLSDRAIVNVITCGPGSQLFTSFGHSAFHIYDPVHQISTVYNFGTFDFDAPNFYLNFAKGKLTYFLSKGSMSRFLQAYNYEQRWVESQELNLNPSQVQAMYYFLENNALEENRYYAYDFFFDNCSTRIEDVVKEVLKTDVQFNNSHINTEKSHRDLIADYTKNAKWGKFGIDLALGSVIDDKATKDEYKFLPDYILAAFNNAEIFTTGTRVPLVKNQRTLLKPTPKPKSAFSITNSPFIVILLVSLILAFFTYRNWKKKSRSRILDFLVFVVTGLVGVVVLLLWFATDHTATYQNYNFLWAFAPNLLVAFYIIKKEVPNWLRSYYKLLIVLLMLMLLFWLFSIQVYNIALLPLIIVLVLRYWVLLRVGEV